MGSRGLTRTLRHRWAIICIVGLLLAGVGIAKATHPTAHAAVAAPGSITVGWGDSTALVKWASVPGASGYQVTLVRLKDMGVMEQFRTPASQLAADAQGIWPGEQYEVAVQALDSSGNAGPAVISSAGQSMPISRTTYNGFLDTENRPAGQIDTNLWDEHIFYSNKPMYGDTFVNGQLHYHLMAGCPSGSDCYDQQTITTMNARVPVDWKGRTATIHGEVDLKGDFHQWFGAVLTPQIIGPDRVLDRVDRMFMPVTMPQLELFTFQGETDLIYARGDGSQPSVLAHTPNPIGLNNVRDDIVWHVSTTHTTVQIDGKTVFDLDWPAPVAFTHGYLSLFAEDYPNSGGTNGQPACDQVPNDCSVWHIDNWGFDAPAGQVQPTSAAYYADGCGPYDGADGKMQQAGECDALNTNDVGNNPAVTVHVNSTANLTDAGVVFDAQRLNGSLAVSVNGSAYVNVPDLATDRNIYDYQSYRVSVPASALVPGANTVRFRVNNNPAGTIMIDNVQIETLSSVPYTPPALPAEPAPLGTWSGGTGGGGGGGGGTATPTPSQSPVQIHNVPCAVMINGTRQTGQCSGSFTPSN